VQLSALEEYGLRCSLQLARSYQDGPLPASRIAEREHLSVEYVSKIMHLFRKAGVVAAERGNQGGFYLARSPAEVPLKAVLESVRTRSDDSHSFCSHYPGQGTQCIHLGECAVRPVWMVLSSYFDEILKTLTLQDLLVREAESEKAVRTLAAGKARAVTTAIRRDGDGDGGGGDGEREASGS